ncbi:MAG: amidohydrolase family protein [Pseudomonadota bacterium]
MSFRFDPEGQRLPIKLDSTSNAEYEPIPLEPRNEHANVLAQQAATDNARRVGLPRREFLISAAGAASSLLAINSTNAAVGKRAGYFQLASDADIASDVAESSLGKREFIFDVQGHYVPPNIAAQRKRECAEFDYMSRDYMRCLGADDFVKDVFLDSDTDMMVLSFVPSRRDAEPLTAAEAEATRQIVDELEGTQRLLVHGRVNPNQDGDLDGMDELAEKYNVSAWKTYTQWGPDGRGFYLTDDIGQQFIDKARKLDVRNICIHKGIPFGRQSYEHSLCTDVGEAAKANPDINFLIYHSGWVPRQPEGPYDPARNEGLDGLIRAVEEAELGMRSNVYAELGSTWRGLMRDVDSAAHGIGKLIKHLGEDNVLWGTDSIWYGSPQDQIQAFRSFQIDESVCDEYGYAPMNDAMRAKIFGLNALTAYDLKKADVEAFAAHDMVTKRRENYRGERDPHYLTFGPKTRREFLKFA